ncbi:BpuSI family type II restriction endonuclease [Deinococcus sp.]|uniref:BpuSI family type II restriction endonuclease n=1 Tax=Deinococcus sp. TaxID=47478 RepID=UPI003C7C15A4
MTWLTYTDDEVTRFHPEFESIADEVLLRLGFTGRFRWDHHVRTPGVQTIPDFVLVEVSTGRWWLVIEIKRSPASVYSDRHQVQAKGYADANQNLYVPARARYFAVTNLEVSLLFALNGTKPVRECRVEAMEFDSGRFSSTPETIHKARLTVDLVTLVDHVLSTTTPTFSNVWPGVVRTMMSHAHALTDDPMLDLSGGVLPRVVSDYFAGGTNEAPKRELLLRCLVAEYLRGILTKYGHKSGVVSLPALRRDVNQAANIIAGLQAIDFRGIFEPTAPALYRDLAKVPTLKSDVEHYLSELMSERVAQLATRNDALELPDVLIGEAYPHTVQNARGKAQTDPELAALLSTLTIDRVDAVVLDPGCGDGALLSAAYDTIRGLGASHAEALARLKGLDADGVATKIAALRLTLKEPFAVDRRDPNHVVLGDMFSSAVTFADVDVVLMNPPFKRYEAQDAAPIPIALRQHFRDAITAISGKVETDAGQPNIYNLYVEFVIKASSPETVFGIILDNRWYHNTVAAQLRAFLLKECEVLAVISYPHDLYFEDWTIATTILIVRKTNPRVSHEVHFVRTNDPRLADFKMVAEALRGRTSYPGDWHVNEVEQRLLESRSWQHHFSKTMTQDFRVGLATLDALFEMTRRGSLAKEGGGIAVYEFPFRRTSYGPRRRAKLAPRTSFQTISGSALTPTQDTALRTAADRIPVDLRGYAVQNSDQLSAYKITVADVTKDETLETPLQRTPLVQVTYFSERRRTWDVTLDAAVTLIEGDPDGAAYTSLVDTEVGLNETVLSRRELWNALREPYAGELIIPRKLRVGHRVHVNPFVYDPSGRQVRLSSNFISYGGCTAVDNATGLTRECAVDLIAAYLLSSFGQVQFEMEGYNREGVLSLEQHQIQKIKVFDPRWIRSGSRSTILAASAALPYPVATDRDPRTQPELQALDDLFAQEIVAHTPTLDVARLLDEVWQTLAEWREARRP